MSDKYVGKCGSQRIANGDSTVNTPYWVGEAVVTGVKGFVRSDIYGFGILGEANGHMGYGVYGKASGDMGRGVFCENPLPTKKEPILDTIVEISEGTLTLIDDNGEEYTTIRVKRVLSTGRKICAEKTPTRISAHSLAV